MNGSHQWTKHDRSVDMPCKEGDCIEAIDEWGVVHKSRYSNIMPIIWMWDHIDWWTYSENHRLEVSENNLYILKDKAKGI